MNSFFAFQFGDFGDSGPNWFDWLSLIVSSVISIGSILGGFWIATRIYSRERRDKDREENEIQSSEIRLFRNSLSQLRASVDNQIASLKDYLERQDFSLEFNQGVHADFLHFINIKYLYKNVGVDQQDEISQINQLLSSLYTLNDFRTSLRDELRSYMAKYNFHEDKFYSYRKLLYTKYFELCNQRGSEFKIENGVKNWKFNNDDLFMIKYSESRIKIFGDEEVINNHGLVDRGKFVERFINPLRNISGEFIPEDYNAIEINDVANEVSSAYADMEEVRRTHFQAIQSYLSVLEDVKNNIGKVL